MYYKISDDGTELLAVTPRDIGKLNPTAEDYAEQGAYPKGKWTIPSIPSDGKIVTRTGYYLGDNGYWQERWIVVDRPALSEQEIQEEQDKSDIKNTNLSNISDMSDDDKDSLLVKAIKVIKSIF